MPVMNGMGGVTTPSDPADAGESFWCTGMS